ncbi:MAG TPA: P-loop NTPase fold protein [Acidobacteriaceae bacterium]
MRAGHPRPLGRSGGGFRWRLLLHSLDLNNSSNNVSKLTAVIFRLSVYVFVDDLDRCDVPKAADLMRALHLMIDDDKRMVFILGMDREKVAAGITAKYSTILQYIDDSREGASADKLAFGYHF